MTVAKLITHHPLAASGILRFTGFRADAHSQSIFAQLMYRGVATFRSGREYPIFYYVVISAPTEPNFYLAMEEVETTMRWASRGILRNWLNAHAFRTGRKHHRCGVVKVEWQPWDEISTNLAPLFS